ncbi:SDR family oxidoreductase [Yersinia sp. IP36721]|uniref:dTDP-4-dehydrorhamnose reductase family protein n=1 Tax=Yersinia sp. IP36721 TaxID=2161716 RepID=UPI000EAF8778|nr:SDR family oxidoreductase [Yersinia sp. IP36721]
MRKKILVLGANGMLGGSIFRHFSENDMFEVTGTVRRTSVKSRFASQGFTNIISGVDVNDFNNINNVISSINPDFIFNCIGIIKQLDESKLPVVSIEINSLLPHKLAEAATVIGAKLIHFSTDCIFSGCKGNYKEFDIPDSVDLYGRSKLLGEVAYGGHITLRTSIIGHEEKKGVSLIDWFLKQESEVFGFKNAIFSGLPTCYMAEVIENFILPNTELHGLYHLSAEPINKFDLLNMVNFIYNKNLSIKEDVDFKIDRSLDSSLFRSYTKYTPLPWLKLIEKMHHEYEKYFK